MKTFSTYEAKTHLSKLIAAVQNGEEIIIAKAGKPVAVLTAYQNTAKRTLGALAGEVVIQDDFDEMPASFMNNFTKA